MENDTFRSRLLGLMQKSRRALRLYSSMERLQNGAASQGEFTELQAQEWKSVNSELLRQLGAALEVPNPKKISHDVFALRDRFLSEFRTSQNELHASQKELISASEHGDFVKAAVLSRELIILKARVQATQAAQHEIEAVIRQSNISYSPIELSDDHIVREPSDIFVQNSVKNTVQMLTNPESFRNVESSQPEQGSLPLARVIPLRKRSS